ncbi:B3 domain-containing protein At3g18960-like isoform X1 [Prunus avium]|uniref:B3 domain-containing protein At3g18960-like isoform X1 n=1 Tax=Prunus avium TaxID=42229 RepID=A0A6P5TRI8_PRUAV|nr:B3 domain-containing protein At3g18960-like isoform X1 [Prunus avium]
MSASLRQKIDHEWPAFSATTPLFLKMILDYISRDAKLRIPKSFVKKYEKHLSNLVHLKLPSGSEWEVEVTTCDGEVWLDKDWPEFSKFYSLEQGGSLVFKYDGNSKFHVCILDASGTEIDYPLVLPVMEETDEDDENNSVEILEDYDDENDNSAEIFGDYQPCPKTRQNSGPLSRPLPRKKNRLSTHSSPEISSSSSKRVVEATNKFISNPSFRVTVGSSLMPHIPVSYPKHFIKLEKQTAKLLVRKKSWCVSLIAHSVNTFPFSVG